MNASVLRIAKLALYYSPKPIRSYISEKAQQREVAHALEVARRTKVTKDDVAQLLEQISVDTDVMLHTSMMNVGKIQGGVNFIAKTILDKVDISRHTLIVSALPYRGRFLDYLREGHVFDVRTAPVAMGAVNEKFVDMEGTVRSIHPTHSVVALGPRAMDYAGEHHLDETPFGLHSPYYKLLKNNAVIMLFGATLNNLTFIHAIEDMVGDEHPVRVYSKHRFVVDCIDWDGNPLKVMTTCHAPFKGIMRDVERVRETMLSSGAMTTVPLGEGEFIMINCRKFTIEYLKMLASGRSIYGRHKVTDKLRDKIDSLLAQLQ